LKIAHENAVPETAFFKADDDGIQLRWFTPEIEMDLCGHATLATAFVLKHFLKHPSNEFIFHTLSGDIKVNVADDIYWLDLPSRPPLPAQLPLIIQEAISLQPIAVLKSRDYVLIYRNEEEIKNLQIDSVLLNRINLDPGGVIVTAKGDQFDFVSRYFTPRSSILEDPVTGSAHCSLIPYWSLALNKSEMRARQLSRRSGDLLCINQESRVLIGGKAVAYSNGKFFLPG
jgi:PhzF family phenazine biosynthesis protein